MKMYSVFDKKAVFYARPFPAKTPGEATRMFSDAVNSDDTLFSAHPADFALYAVGSFDESTGVHESVTPVFIIEAASLVRCEADA